jgi:hypothetical protein
VKGLHDLFRWYIRIETVNLKEIDVVRLQSRKRIIDLVEDRGTGEAVMIDVAAGFFEFVSPGTTDGRLVANEVVTLGENDDLVARDVELPKSRQYVLRELDRRQEPTFLMKLPTTFSEAPFE